MIRVYDLRHTFASNALAETGDVLAVAELPGHASPKMVLDVYGHVMPGQESVTARLAERYAAAAREG
jgi:integrase